MDSRFWKSKFIILDTMLIFSKSIVQIGVDDILSVLSFYVITQQIYIYVFLIDGTQSG